jgi:hypothetical protein
MDDVGEFLVAQVRLSRLRRAYSRLIRDATLEIF